MPELVEVDVIESGTVLELTVITPRPPTIVEIGGGSAIIRQQFSPPVTFAGHFRIKADGTFQLWNQDQNLWHTISISGIAGAETLDISAGEA
jgi:hypothetical protein